MWRAETSALRRAHDPGPLDPLPAYPEGLPAAERAGVSFLPLMTRLAGFTRRAHWKRGFLLWMRFAGNPIVTLRWWRFLMRFSAMEQLALPHDDLLQKPFSKFLIANLGSQKRLALLTTNFHLARECFSRSVMAAIWAGEAVQMSVISGRSDDYRCSLALADRFGGRHEGAFAIRLIRCRDEATVWTAKFMFVNRGDVRTIVVGGMQGPHAAKQEMVAVTRDLCGLRPKEAVLMVMQAYLGQGAHSFFAISQARHPINHRRRRRQKMLLSDIDAFWNERLAMPESMFGFEVPISTMDGSDKRSRIKKAFFEAAARLCAHCSPDLYLVETLLP
ncbi:DUF535 family protein [Agrobacterium pusense]|uniref:DUF535 family protein n=1 Tax=Agrobacterium pusense TaxID=648995 RepID=UPI002FCE3DB2